MKKVISLCLLLLLIVAVAFTAPTGAADDLLTVTANGADPATYRIGEKIVFTVRLDTGTANVINGHGYLYYDPAYLDPVEHTDVYKGSESVEAYSFCRRVCRCGPFFNYSDPGTMIYVFSSAKGLGAFPGNDEFFMRFQFRVKAAGTTDISHVMWTLCNYDESYIYNNGVPDESFSPVMTAATAAAPVLLGDVDGSETVDSRDALILDRYVAGWQGYDELIVDRKAADLSGDGVIGNRDAIMLDRYLAGWEGYDQYIVEVLR